MTPHRVRPCGCAAEGIIECECGVDCGWCWPDFKDEQHEIAIFEDQRADDEYRESFEWAWGWRP